jgi:transcriptional regulator with XRE-family HTH domain
LTQSRKGGAVLRIKHARLALGWSQVNLAHYAHVSISELSKIETGRLIPSAAQNAKLASALRIAPDELLQHVSDEHSEVARSQVVSA